MSDALGWWLAVEVIGVLAFPIGYVFLHRLPDRGYAFTKVLGLLLVGYLLWIGAVLGVISNSRGSILLILLGLAVVGVVLWGRRREEIGSFFRERWRYILFVEAMFLVTFLVAAWLRSYVPEIGGTEKPYEFAYLNSILRSEQFPPNDPWLSGFFLSYYYFGFVMVGALIKLTGVAVSIGFNLSLALIAALTVVAAFGVVYNLVAASGRARHALTFGLLGVLLIVILGNLEGLFELMAAHSVGSSALYTWVDVDGLNLQDAGGTNEWFPDKFFWWWRSTRLPTNWDIKEYPFFSFLLGDLHPHVMVMPFTLLAMATGFNILRSGSGFNYQWILRNPLVFLLLAIIIGSLAFLNAWSLPPTLALVALAVFARNWWQRKRRLRPALGDTLGFLLPLGALAFVLYLPFYWTSIGAAWSLAPVEVLVAPVHLPLDHMVTQPKHLFFSWGPLLWLAFGLAVTGLGWRWLAKLGWKGWWALLPALLPLALWTVLALGDLGPSRFIDELQLRGPNLLTLALLAGFITLITLAFARALTRPDGRDESFLFVLGAVGVSVMLIFGTELFFQLDHLNGSRENTVFKLWHHAWLFLAVGGAFAIYHVLFSAPRPPKRRGRPAGEPVEPPRRRFGFPTVSWASVATLLILASLVFPVAATFSRTNGFEGASKVLGIPMPWSPFPARTLDGLAFARSINPQEDEAVRWLNDNVSGTPVILEAVGDPFTEGGRISSRTGLPTVLEWPYHQVGNRGGDGPLGQRRQEVEQVYTSASFDEAAAVLDKYDVQYVVVGGFEREQYGEAGLAKFGESMETVFQNDGVTIYRMPQTVGAPSVTVP